MWLAMKKMINQRLIDSKIFITPILKSLILNHSHWRSFGETRWRMFRESSTKEMMRSRKSKALFRIKLANWMLSGKLKWKIKMSSRARSKSKLEALTNRIHQQLWKEVWRLMEWKWSMISLSLRLTDLQSNQ